MNIPMWVVWLILVIVFAVIEAATLGLATVWFAIGSGVAMVMDLCGAPLAAQIITMIVVSIISFIICFIWIRPKIDKKGKVAEPTNADRVIGKEGIVIKEINPVDGKGQIKVMGQVWSAKADSSIAENKKVKVLSMEGVKLVVEEINE
ncbi:MAG: NfeD family protein [Saccharofermentans sp.]|nr:NfeD family protein [Saccharofermentans sp.]